jgi:hypothetical protein
MSKKTQPLSTLTDAAHVTDWEQNEPTYYV